MATAPGVASGAQPIQLNSPARPLRVIKSPPFDSTQRSGAFLFVHFLHRNGRLLNADGQPVINDMALASLALLVAESDPAQKNVLIR